MAEQPKIVVWGIETPRTLRVHWALHELGLDYETRPIGSRTGETRSSAYQALNPRQKIPAIEIDGEPLAESAAIVTALGERFGGDFVPPAGTPERGRYYQWCFWIMTELDAHTLYVMRRHRDLADLYGEAPNAIEAAQDYFIWQAEVAAAEIEARGPFLLGDHFTGADLLLTTCLDWAHLYGVPLPDELADYRAGIAKRPAYRRALAANFPTGMPAAAQEGNA
jgi:glutathione S-transferase